MILNKPMKRKMFQSLLSVYLACWFQCWFSINLVNISAGNRTRIRDGMTCALPLSYWNVLVECLLLASDVKSTVWGNKVKFFVLSSLKRYIDRNRTVWYSEDELSIALKLNESKRAINMINGGWKWYLQLFNHSTSRG